MTLRKCPACHEMVGGESEICPRCGVSFRNAIIMRLIRLAIVAALAVWLVVHFRIW